MPPRKSTSSVTPADAEDATATSQIQTTEQQLKAQAEGGVSVEDYLLPRALTQRLAKSVLPPNTTIQKDALLAIQKAATVFISYLSSHANEATLKRTLAPSDVFAALTELEFDSFRPRLERELEAHTEAIAGKKRATKEKKAAAAAKPTDAEAAANVGGGGGGGAAEVADVGVDDDETTTRDVKRVKRDSHGVAAPPTTTTTMKESDETEEEEPDEDETEEVEEEEEDEEEDDDDDEDVDGEDEEEHEGTAAEDNNNNVDRVEDLDAVDSRRKPGRDDDDDDDDDDSDDYDDDGPAAQLRQNLGLG